MALVLALRPGRSAESIVVGRLCSVVVVVMMVRLVVRVVLVGRVRQVVLHRDVDECLLADCVPVIWLRRQDSSKITYKRDKKDLRQHARLRKLACARKHTQV